MKTVMFFWNALLRVQRIVMFITSLCVLSLMAAAAFMRYFLEMDFFGMEDLVLIVAFWMYFMGGAYASYEKSHISAEVVSAYIKNEHVKRVLKLMTAFITTAMSWIFSYWGYLLLLWGLESGRRTVMLHIHILVPQSAIILGFFLMTLYATVHFVNEIRSYLDWRRGGTC